MFLLFCSDLKNLTIHPMAKVVGLLAMNDKFKHLHNKLLYPYLRPPRQQY